VIITRCDLSRLHVLTCSTSFFLFCTFSEVQVSSSASFSFLHPP
jgi:hypothetical protein